MGCRDERRRARALHGLERVAFAAPRHVSLGDPFGDEIAVVVGDGDFTVVLREFWATERRDAPGAEEDDGEQEKGPERVHGRTMAAGPDARKCRNRSRLADCGAGR